MKRIILFLIFIVFITILFIGYSWYSDKEMKYLQQKIFTLEQDLSMLRKHLDQLESSRIGIPGSELSFGIRNTTIVRFKEAFLPLEFPLKKDFSGVIILESFRDIHFLENNRIHFKVKVSGKNIRYEGKKGIMSIFSNQARDLLTIKSFTAEGECMGDMVYRQDIPGLEIKLKVNRLKIPNVASLVEKLLTEQLNREMAKKPQRVKIKIKPQEIEVENKKRILTIIPQRIQTMGTNLYLLGSFKLTPAGKPAFISPTRRPSGPARPAR